MRFKPVLILFLLLLSYSQIKAQQKKYSDRVVLNDSIIIECKIIEIGHSEITILYRDSAISKIPLLDVVDYKIADKKAYRRDQKEKYKGYSNNTVFFEVFGSGILWSINYDRIFYHQNDFMSSFRIGYFQAPVGALLPLELNCIWNGKNPACHTEIGFGYTPLVGGSYKSSKCYIRIGFRYQLPEGGLFFRVGFIPFYQFPYVQDGFNNTGYFMPWYGFSIGYTIPESIYR